MSTQTAASAVIEGTDAIFGWGPAKLFHAGLEELAFYHQTADGTDRLAHAAAAQAYAFLALGKADPDVQEQDRPGRADVTAGQVVAFLSFLEDRKPMSADETDALATVLAVLTRDETAYRS
jgi:hypothetical protein